MFFWLMAFGLVGLTSCEPPPEATVPPQPKLGTISPEPAIHSHAGKVLRSPQEHGGIRFLSEAEIRTLMGPTRVTTLMSDGPVHLSPAPDDRQEVFYPNGRYRLEGRTTLVGSYTVHDGALCTQIANRQQQCRSVFRGSDGELRLGTSPGSTWGQVPMRFVAKN